MTLRRRDRFTATGWVLVALSACGGEVTGSDGLAEDGGDGEAGGGAGASGPGGSTGQGGGGGRPSGGSAPGGSAGVAGGGVAGGGGAAALCGDGRIQPDEPCDGDDFGGETCASETMGLYPVGRLRCTARCVFDLSGCTSAGTGGATGAGGRPGTGGGGQGGSAGGIYGDPHVFTPDGLEYEFQAVGEFVALEDPTDPGFRVQVRLRPFEQLRTLSAVTMVAVSVGGDRVTIAAGAPPTVRVDGAERAVTGQIALPHGGQVLAQGTRVVVEWPSGEGLVVDGAWDALLNASYRRGSSTRNLRGLLGNADGVADNDLSTRDGRLVARANDPGALYADFGESYRVRPTESLFDYAAGETTESLTDRGFPHGPREVLALPVARRRAAHLACAVQGVTDPAAFEACTRDVALTGDLRFARAAAAVGRGR